jgi:hypothetical protein
MTPRRNPWLVLGGALLALGAGIGAAVIALVVLAHTVA